MFFRQEYVTKSLVLPALREPQTFLLKMTRSFETTILPDTEDKAQMLCRVSCSLQPSQRVAEAFQSLLRREIPEGVAESSKSEWAEYLDGEGRIKVEVVPPRRVLPGFLVDFLHQIDLETSEVASKVIRTIRWRQGTHGLPRPVHSVRAGQWSLDGQEWLRTPVDYRLVWQSGLKVSTSINHDDVQALLESHVMEPLGHEMFIEAWGQLMNRNLRSALVIGASAAEVGFKECVKDLLPEATWLLEKVASPSLVDMLQHFLPQLPARLKWHSDKVIPPPKQTIELLKKGIALRNRVVHVGELVKEQTVWDFLVAVRSVLWLLDFYRGNRWAREFIDPGHWPQVE